MINLSFGAVMGIALSIVQGVFTGKMYEGWQFAIVTLLAAIFFQLKDNKTN